MRLTLEQAQALTTYALAIHGGAGALSTDRVPAERIEEMRRDLGIALERGLGVLGQGGSALDAVVSAVCVLEDSRVFNAGRGAVLRRDATARLDASVMNGQDRRAGAVCLVRTAQNPVLLARAVLDRGREVLLAGLDADRLALELGLVIQPPEYFITDYRSEQLERLAARDRTAQGPLGIESEPSAASKASHGEEGETVGAVALDAHGHLAAATSTGGTTNACPGRVGDSPIVGAGTWASDTTCAVSATGGGEFFIRAAFAHEVHSRLLWSRDGIERATRGALDLVVELGGHGGCVAIDGLGRVVAPFTTLAMPRAYGTAGGERHVYVLEPCSEWSRE